MLKSFDDPTGDCDRFTNYAPPPRHAAPLPPYKARTRTISAVLSTEEHAALTRIARRNGLAPCAFARARLRAIIAAENAAPMQPDDYEDSAQAYGEVTE